MHVGNKLKKTNNNEQIDLVLGVSENGVIFVHPTTLQIIERYKMEEILTYGFRSNAFLFVAGTLMTQRKYQFATMLGKQMNDLLRAHIDLRMLFLFPFPFLFRDNVISNCFAQECNRPRYRDIQFSIDGMCFL